ncbi:MAG TPA: hypothetical protein VGM37_16140 [Armatimonadota bacterium]|jgi:hypothetical protein
MDEERHFANTDRTRITEVRFGRTVGLPHFGSVRFEATAEIGVGPDGKPQSARTVSQMLMEYVDNECRVAIGRPQPSAGHPDEAVQAPAKETPDPPAQPTIPPPAANGGKPGIERTFQAMHVVKTMDEKGTLRVRLKGHPFTQFGVDVYPERWPLMPFDVESLGFGETAIPPTGMIVEMEEDPENLDAEGKPKLRARRVLGPISTAAAAAARK